MGIQKIIDVSEHNGKINWEKARSHIDGVIIRCGYGMDMTSQDDKHWKRNADECTRLGIPFGVYLYSYANTEGKSRSVAAHVLRLIKKYKLSFPVYLDLEEEHSPDTRAHAVHGAKIFADIVGRAGYVVGIYANENWYKNIIGSSLDKYTKWVAKYSSQAPDVTGVDIWQYTSSGNVPGLTGNNGMVDINYCYRDFVKEITDKNNIAGQESGSISTALPNITQAVSGGNKVIKDGQIHLNNFTGLDISADGVRGIETIKGGIMVLQTALNMDYHTGLNIDGIWGPKSDKALDNHYVCRGECQYMVTAVEILLMLKGYNPNGVECPGSFGSELESAVRQYQNDHGLTVDGIAGRNTFKSLIV